MSISQMVVKIKQIGKLVGCPCGSGRQQAHFYSLLPVSGFVTPHPHFTLWPFQDAFGNTKVYVGLGLEKCGNAKFCPLSAFCLGIELSYALVLFCIPLVELA